MRLIGTKATNPHGKNGYSRVPLLFPMTTMRFPLILRRNENDSKKYFGTEADSLELPSRSEEESL
jgi:hypothetical protein